MHGCPKCFSSNSFYPLKKQTIGYLYKACSERTLFIKCIVKQFIEIWECEWDRNVKENLEVKEFCSNSDVSPSLKPVMLCLVEEQMLLNSIINVVTERKSNITM
jgi:hypothetical protein